MSDCLNLTEVSTVFNWIMIIGIAMAALMIRSLAKGNKILHEENLREQLEFEREFELMPGDEECRSDAAQ